MKTWKQFVQDDAGQDLIEYVLVVAMIAFAACVGMSAMAVKINAAFISIGGKVASYTS